jgi:maleate isomerase
LMSVEPGVIAYGCTAGSFLKGAADDQAMCARLINLTGVPFLTTSSAVTEALRHLRVRRIAMATPYLDSVNEHEKRYLGESAGVEVVSMKGLNIVGNLPKGRLGPEVAAALVREVDHPEAEAIFISCTNFRTMEVLAPLEAELGKPVFSSNQATLWGAMRAANYHAHIRGYGLLLEMV